MSKRRNRSTATQVVVGTPVFGNNPNLEIQGAMGQINLIQKTRGETQDWREVAKKLTMEYSCILFALKEMRVNFVVADAYRQYMQPGTLDMIKDLGKKMGFKMVRFPEISLDTATFVRDFATSLPDGTLLVEFDPKRITSGQKATRRKVIRSPHGVGGRVLMRRQVALMSEQVWILGDELKAILPDTKPFETAGLKVGLLPSAVNVEIFEGQPGNTPDDHSDRTSGLLEDPRTGELHLVVDPNSYSGWQHPFRPPLHGPKETLERYQRVCDKLEIHLRIPKAEKLAVAASICFWQAKNGRVLMTSGDDPVAEAVAGIVGEDNLFLTHEPIRYFPAWSKAGIHCLINDIPSWILG